jgi:hypothetical protein
MSAPPSAFRVNPRNKVEVESSDDEDNVNIKAKKKKNIQIESGYSDLSGEEDAISLSDLLNISMDEESSSNQEAKDESNDGNDKQIHNNNTSKIILQLPFTTNDQFSSNQQAKDESNDGNDKRIHNNNTSKIILQLPLTTNNQFSSNQQAKEESNNDVEELRTSAILKNTTMSWTSADFSLANTKEETMTMFTFSIVHFLNAQLKLDFEISAFAKDFVKLATGNKFNITSEELLHSMNVTGIYVAYGFFKFIIDNWGTVGREADFNDQHMIDIINEAQTNGIDANEMDLFVKQDLIDLYGQQKSDEIKEKLSRSFRDKTYR